MSAADEFAPSPEFLDAMRYAAIAVVIGRDPDDPDSFAGEVFHFTPSADRPRRTISASDCARMLRQTADEIEAVGLPL